MEEVSRQVRITNAGERSAKLIHEIVMLRVLDEVYVVKDNMTSAEQSALLGTENVVSEEEMNRIIAEEYPFKVNVESSTEVLEIDTAGTITMKFNWGFESGDDEADTQFATESYKYYEENPDYIPIQVKIKLKAQQTE